VSWDGDTQEEIREGELDPKEYFRRADGFKVVSSIERIPGEHTVYNLEIDDDPTYIAEGIIVHNCRFLDGTIISVADAYGVSEASANVSRPEDIYNTSPFVNPVWTDADGRRLRRGDEGRRDHRELQTTTGTRLAIIDRSGVGRKDDPGQFRGLIGGNHLHDAHLGPPPYHHACRSYTVPRMDIHSVPQGYAAVATDGPLLPPGSAAPGLRPVEYHREPTLRNPLRVGSSAPLDALILPAQVLERLVFPPARERDTWAAVRSVVPHPDAPTMVLQRAAAHSVSRDDLAALTAHRPSHLFDGLSGHADGMLLVGARTALTPEQIVGLATHPAAAGRDLVVRVGIRARRAEQWMRVVQAQAPRGALQAAARAVTTGRWTAAEYEAWLKAAQRDGWLRMGAKLDDVMIPPSLRGGVVPPPPVSPRVPPPPSAPTVVPPMPVPAGFRAGPVPPTLYTARPTISAVRRAVTAERPHGYARIARTGAADLPALDAWQPMHIGDAWALPDMSSLDALRLSPDAAVVHLWTPGVLTRSSVRRLYSRIIDHELDLGLAGVRDWVVQDVRGVSWFMRVDGAAAARLPRADIDAALQNLFAGGDAADAALRYLRRGVADSTATLTQFYPQAVVDWGAQRGLLPGVPLREQAMRRTAAVRAEVEDAIAAYRAAGLAASDATGRAVEEALQREALAGTDVTRGLTARGARSARPRARMPGADVGHIVRTRSELLATPFKEVSAERYRELQRVALRDASAPLRDAIAATPAPYALEVHGVKRADCAMASRIDAMPRPAVIALSGGDPARTLAHEYHHVLDTVGLTGDAMRHVRNARVGAGRLVDLYKDGKEWGLPGTWVEDYASKVYAADMNYALAQGIKHEHDAVALRNALDAVTATDVLDGAFSASEYHTVTAQHLAGIRSFGGRDVDLDRLNLRRLWEADPDAVSGYIAAHRGAFVPQ